MCRHGDDLEEGAHLVVRHEALHFAKQAVAKPVVIATGRTTAPGASFR